MLNWKITHRNRVNNVFAPPNPLQSAAVPPKRGQQPAGNTDIWRGHRAQQRGFFSTWNTTENTELSLYATLNRKVHTRRVYTRPTPHFLYQSMVLTCPLKLYRPKAIFRVISLPSLEALILYQTGHWMLALGKIGWNLAITGGICMTLNFESASPVGDVEICFGGKKDYSRQRKNKR